jgi:hypothetical protein
MEFPDGRAFGMTAISGRIELIRNLLNETAPDSRGGKGVDMKVTLELPIKVYATAGLRPFSP